MLLENFISNMCVLDVRGCASILVALRCAIKAIKVWTTAHWMAHRHGRLQPIQSSASIQSGPSPFAKIPTSSGTL